jgi:DmsE family decaheme c-type cytochrome
MNINKPTISILLVVAALAWPVFATAQDAGASAAKAPAPAASVLPDAGPGSQYSEKGADTCLRCHDEESDTATFKVAGIFKTRHAQRGNAHAPFGAGGLQCEACHGPGDRHTKAQDKKATINSLKADSFLPAEQRNQACLACHQNRARTGWHASAHDRGGVACTDCHQLHVERDPVLSKSSQPEVCFGCHKTQRADFWKASSHPVRFGSMGCSDCHSPHGSTSTALLIKATVNQTCFTCHADKRGPFLWEHAPVAEDCTLCHTAHGSAHASLLTKTPPLLCQQCHSQEGHPSAARTGAALPGGGGGGSIFVVGGSCTNCHSQVHGSNHPAGAMLLR